MTTGKVFHNLIDGEWVESRTGQTFENLSERLLGGPPDGAVSDLVVDPGVQNRFYAGVVGRGIYRSTDWGESWGAVATQPRTE